MELYEIFRELRAIGVILSESFSVDEEGPVLNMRVRVGVDDLDPAALPLYCAYVIDTLATTLKENRRLRDRLTQARSDT